MVGASSRSLKSHLTALCILRNVLGLQIQSNMVAVGIERIRIWRGSIPKTVVISLCLVALGALMSCIVFTNRAIDVSSQVIRMNAQLSAAAAAKHGERSTQADFANRLPRAPLTAPLLEEFRRAAAESGVALSSVSTDAREPTERTLGRPGLSPH